MGSIVSVTYVNFPLENNTSQMVGLFFEFYFFVMMNIRQGEKGNSSIIVYKKWISVKVKKGIPIYIFWKKMNVRQGEKGNSNIHFLKENECPSRWEGGVYTFFYPKKTQFFGNFMYAKLNNLQFKIAKCMKYFSHSFAVILFFAGLKKNNIKKKQLITTIFKIKSTANAWENIYTNPKPK